MKRLTSGLIALAFVTTIPAAAFAQTSTGTDRSRTDRTTTERSKKERPAFTNTQALHETGDIIGTRVQDAAGKDIGKVEALLIDPTEGKVSHAVVGVGGLLGVGEEKVVVPYSALKMTGHEGGRKAKIALDQSTLDSAPKYVKATDRAPSASPATSPRSDTSRDATGRPTTDKPTPDAKTDRK